MKLPTPPFWSRLLMAVVLALGAAALGTAATRGLAFLQALENVARDIRVALMQPEREQSDRVVVVAITEDTLAQFPYRSPVDREFLADLLERLQAVGPRVIGVDVLFDQATEVAKDERLKQVLREARVPLVVSYTDTPDVVNEAQLAYLREFVPPNLRAAGNLATDPFDGAVRWIFRGERRPDEPSSFPLRVAQAAGTSAPPPGELEIAWRAQPDAQTPPFPVIPAHLALALPLGWMRDRVVLIGAVESLIDRHRTPMAVVHADDRGQMPGVLIQAHSTDQLLEGRVVARWPAGGEALFTLAVSALGVGLGLSMLNVRWSVGLGALAMVLLWWAAFAGHRHGLALVPLVGPTLSFALALWMTDLRVGRAERRQRQFLQSAFSRYVSPAVVDRLVEDPSLLSIRGQRQEASFIFTDIAGFTTLSEQLPSETLSALINDYLDGACRIVQRHDGMVDKFIGDAIMALFNAPLPQADHVQRAVRCALELDAYAENFRQAANRRGIALGVTRLGVHTGVATIGNFGSQSRMEFTALGDTVNTAARTEGVNKYFGTRVCCTQAIVDRAPDLCFRPIGQVVLKGKTEAVGLFSPLDSQAAQALAYAAYISAYRRMQAGDAAGARLQLEALARDDPADGLVRFHLDRLDRGEVGVRIVMEDK